VEEFTIDNPSVISPHRDYLADAMGIGARQPPTGNFCVLMCVRVTDVPGNAGHSPHRRRKPGRQHGI